MRLVSEQATGGGDLPLISVVVPVYNVERYLCQCVDSILAQTYPNIEVVLVDDGSPDGCPALCDAYAERCDNVIAVHRKNGGLSAARNTGTDAAHGDYIGYIDSDDYISPVFYEALYHAVEESDCAMAALRYGVEFYDSREPELEQDLVSASAFEVETGEEYQEEILYQKSWAGAVWRLYRRDLADEVRFPEGFYYEDDATAYLYAHKCDRVAVLGSTRLYAYRQNESGIMRGLFNEGKLVSAMAITQQMRDDMHEWYPQLDAAVASRCFAILRVVFSQVPSDDGIYQRVLWQEMQNYATAVVHDPNARKKERLAAGISKLGRGPFRAFCNLYRAVLHAQ